MTRKLPLRPVIGALLLLTAQAALAEDDQTTVVLSSSASTQLGAAKAQTALVLLRRGQVAPAQEAATQALALAPQLAVVQHAAARVAAQTGSTGEAELHYQTAVRLAPDDPHIRQDYGRFLCYDRARYAEAEEQFQAEADSPSYVTPEVGHLDAGLCALQANDTARAQAHFVSALRMNPRFPDALVQMSRLEYQAGHVAEAHDYMQRAAQLGTLSAEDAQLLNLLNGLAAGRAPSAAPQQVATMPEQPMRIMQPISQSAVPTEVTQTQNAAEQDEGFQPLVTPPGESAPVLAPLRPLANQSQPRTIATTTKSRAKAPSGIEAVPTPPGEDAPVVAPVRPLAKSKTAKAAAKVSANSQASRPEVAAKSEPVVKADKAEKSAEPTFAELAQLQFPGDFSNDKPSPVRGNDWVMSQPADAYTLQLLTTPREADVMAYLKHHDLKHMLAYAHYVERGKPQYVLLYGSFSSEAHAKDAQNDLPESLRGGTVSARRYATLQGLIKP